MTIVDKSSRETYRDDEAIKFVYGKATLNPTCFGPVLPHSTLNFRCIEAIPRNGGPPICGRSQDLRPCPIYRILELMERDINEEVPQRKIQ